jgi:RNA polymerase-binding transcription factor DksA
MAFDPRRALEDDLARTRTRLAALTGDHAAIVEASVGSNADDEHDPEGATIAFERSQVESLVRQARDHAAELEAALRRVDDATYGICESCGGPIPLERLQARPVARRCVGC